MTYNNIRKINGDIYEHKVIIHQHNFVNPEDANIQTQNLCARAKCNFKRQYVMSELFTSLSHEFIQQNAYRKSHLSAIIICMIYEYIFKSGNIVT